MKRKVLAAFLVAFVLFLVVRHAAAALYPFGGLITSYSVCYVFLPAIVVGLPSPGTFIIPPATLLPFFNLTPGAYVLGMATSPFCGFILFVGTTPPGT